MSHKNRCLRIQSCVSDSILGMRVTIPEVSDPNGNIPNAGYLQCAAVLIEPTCVRILLTSL